MFNVKFRSNSALPWQDRQEEQLRREIANQPSDETNNQLNRGLISIRNLKERSFKGRKMIDCKVLTYLFGMFYVTIYFQRI